MSKSGFMGITILGGLLSATLALLPMTLIPGLAFFSYFAPLPLFLLGLGRGLRPLLGAGFLAAALILLVEGPILTAQFFLFFFLGPVFLVHRTLINWKKNSTEIIWYSPSFLLRDFTLLSGIIMILALGVYLYFMQGTDIPTLTKALLSSFDSQAHVQDVESLLIKIFPFLPGFFTFSWMLMMLFNAALAQGFLTRLKANMRPTPSFKALYVPKSFLIVLGLSLLLSFVGVGTLELLGKNAALVLGFPFFLTGLGIIHYLLCKTPFAKTGLTVFYALLLLFLWPALFVIFLGILRPWIEKPTTAN